MSKRILLVLLSSLSVSWSCINETGWSEEFGIEVRKKPVLNFRTIDTIRVGDFGAIPGDEIVDTYDIQKAINEAISLKSAVVIQFEPGIYRLDSHAGRYALSIRNADSIIFEGAGAEFIMVRPEILLLSVENSSNVIIRNFAVDYYISPFTQGWVKEICAEERWLKVEIDSGWPSPEMKNFREADYKWAFIKDRNNLPAFKEGTEFRLYLESWENIEDNVWLYHTRYTSKLITIEAGDPFVQISRVDGCLISISNSADITLHNLRLYESPACMLGSGNSSRVNYIDIEMSPKPGSWMSSGADGCFNVDGREGPWVEGCTFNALGDDNLVIKGTGAFITDVINDSTFCLVRARHRFLYPPLSFERYLKRDSIQKWNVKEGDILEIVDPLRQRIICKPQVTGVDSLPNSLMVTTDQPVPGIRPGTLSDSSLTVFNSSNCLPGFVVRNNRFFNAPRFGFLLKSHDGIIEDNHFMNHSDQSIAMINSYQEFGGRVYNILVRGNKFEGAGGWPVKTAETAQHSLARPYGRNILSVVTAAFTVPRGQWDIAETRSIELSNLYIIDNEFVNWWQLPALTIMNTDCVHIEGNRFIRDKEFAEKDTLWLGKKPLRILYCRNVEIGKQIINNRVMNLEQIEIIDSENVNLMNNKYSSNISKN